LPANAVLLVDDDVDFSAAMVQSMAERGVTVIPVVDSLQAMQLLAVWRPSVILLDVMLPLMSGLDLLAVMKRDPDLASIPVFMVTASHTRTVPGTPVFHKPLNLESVVRAVRACQG
jgi:CheY-like chemotaxis protein